MTSGDSSKAISIARSWEGINELETVKLHPKCKIHVIDQIARPEEVVYLISGLKLIAHSLQSLGKVVASSLDLQIRVVRQSR